jgi:RNA polymerase sigma factor (sigma-70 family)
MGEKDVLAERFEEHRSHLRAVAYRMLGSSDEAEDAVQESWVKLSRADTSGVDNLGAWLTTVVARVCLDMLRSRKSRREAPMPEHLPGELRSEDAAADPEHEAVMADSVGIAMLVVLETLTPPERLAFVLHDLFAVPFEEIAPIVDRSPAAARQLASRARRRVQGASPEREADAARQREVVDAFLAASREGDFERLLSVLDPEVVLRADPAAVKASAGREAQGAPRLAPEIRGARAVAGALSGGAAGAQPALVDGSPGAAWAPGGRPRAAFGFTVRDGRIVEIEVVVDPETLRDMEVVVLDR